MSATQNGQVLDGGINDPRWNPVWDMAAWAGARAGRNPLYAEAVMVLLEQWLGLGNYPELPDATEFPNAYVEARRLFIKACRGRNFAGLPGQSTDWYREAAAQV